MGIRVEIILKANIQKKGHRVQKKGLAQHADANEDCSDCIWLHPEANVNAEKQGLFNRQVGEDVKHDHVEDVPVSERQ